MREAQITSETIKLVGHFHYMTRISEMALGSGPVIFGLSISIRDSVSQSNKGLPVTREY